VSVTQMTTFVFLECCNRNVTLKTIVIPTETCWLEYYEYNASQNIKVHFVGCLYIFESPCSCSLYISESSCSCSCFDRGKPDKLDRNCYLDVLCLHL